MNKQYQELQVQEGVYIPQPALQYPEENPFERTLFPKQIKHIDFDEHYPYINDSFKYRFNMLWGQAAGRPDGAVGIRGDHAGGESGIHPHAGRRHPAFFWTGADPDGAGRGTGAVGR